MLLDKLMPFFEFIAYFGALLSGWLICSQYGRDGYTGGESRMRAKLLLQLLQMSPEERSDRILDLFFFVLSGKTTEVPEEVLPEILEHLERRIGGTETVQRSEWFRTLSTSELNRYCDAQLRVTPSRRRNFALEIKENWNIPTVERPMGFEKEIARVQKRIEEYKRGISSTKAKMAENIDLEKGPGWER
ncbi:uncharacterized protein EAF02_002444 [Botrytis sinoallii]|uniref:uncharacterized protein n=1 Tax=Botrytis sinoallii TaxID=1463999 RepID=UPI0019007E60|nr:uncharacterized protein EAF02_002444 [Botrytis sinoallii]KAF7890029.1 hypothetical protein EAF02_002444 [Botrytis sinoallii]